MAPYTNIPLSPAELSYLHTSLCSNPPIRPDGRSQTQFRTLIAENSILPSANGSARVCFADGTEAVVGVKAEVEKTKKRRQAQQGTETAVHDDDGMDEDEKSGSEGRGDSAWLEIAVEIPGMRDDDALPVFLSEMLSEALLADGRLKDRLWINSRFHWRLYVDILLLSQPLSYPLPLLSLTAHLALLETRLPALVSEGDEDPLFNDDWEASVPLYPSTSSDSNDTRPKPAVTLLVMSVGSNILFDPSRDELAVADAVLAISVSHSGSQMKVVAIRTIDPPSRLTAAGIPNVLNTTGNGGAQTLSPAEAMVLREKDEGMAVWRPPRGGLKRGLVSQIVSMVVAKGGVGEEVMEGLERVER